MHQVGVEHVMALQAALWPAWNTEGLRIRYEALWNINEIEPVFVNVEHELASCYVVSVEHQGPAA